MLLGPVSKIKIRKILDDQANTTQNKTAKIKTEANYILKQKNKFKKLNMDFLDLNFNLSGEIDESIIRVEKTLEEQKRLKYNSVLQNHNNFKNKDQKDNNELVVPQKLAIAKQEIPLKETKVYAKEDVNNNTINVENTNVLSRILDFSTTRPIECIKNIDTSIDLNYYLEPSKYLTNEQLNEICSINTHIKYLDLSNCDRIMDWSPISKLVNLEQLDLNNCDYIIDLDFLKTLKKLKVLNIGNTDVKYLDALIYLENLETINLTSNPVADLTPLKNCLNLKDIVLWGCMSIKNIDVVAKFTQLELLDIESCPIPDLNCIKNLKNLETLLMDNCNTIKDFSFLENLTTLKYFTADGNTIIGEKNLNFFKNLVNLEYLSLRGRSLVKIEFIKNSNKIKELVLSDNMVSDLTPLENMTEMIKIALGKNRELKELGPLKNMHKLEKLDISAFSGTIKGKSGTMDVSVISAMNITDLSVLQNFPNLKELNATANYRLKDISYLIYCKNVEELYLNACTQLENVDVIGTLSRLRILELKSNPRIRDLYCVSKLENLEMFNYNGTLVQTIKMVNILKRCTKLYSLRGNDSSDFLVKFIDSAQKRVKLYKSRKRYNS